MGARFAGWTRKDNTGDMHVSPKTRYGKRSLALIVAMFVLFVIGSMSINLYQNIPEGSGLISDIPSRPVLALSMLTGMLSGLVSMIFGLMAIVKEKEQSLLVYLSTLIGMLLALFVLGDIAFPE